MSTKQNDTDTPTRTKPRMTFEQATARYVHRYTMDHVPVWALTPAPNGKHYAPQFRTDREWYENTVFPPHNPLSRTSCYTTNQTWPLGLWLAKPFTKTGGH